METGNRKLIVFFAGLIAVLLLLGIAFFKEVAFTGDNVERLCWVIFFFVLTFTGGNSLEWFAKAFNKGQPIEQIK